MKLAVIFVAVAPPAAPKTALRPFAKVDGREVFMRAIELYTPRDEAVQKVLVVLPDDLQTVHGKYAAHLGFQGVQVTAGGPDWFGAVSRALEKLKPEIDAVLIHDATRPAVPYTLLDALEAALENADAAVPVQAVTMTLASLDPSAKSMGPGNPYVAGVNLNEIQSPQIFQKDPLIAAYAARPGLTGKLILDDASLLRAANPAAVIATVPGSKYNQRIDSDEAVRYGGDLLKHLPRPKSKAALNPFGEAEW